MPGKMLIALSGWLVFADMALGQAIDSPAPPEPVLAPLESTVGPTSAPSSAPRGGDLPIAGNPGAVNIVTGTGKLGEWLGFEKESGVRLGGLWIGDSNWLATGGLEPGQWALNSLTQIALTLDAEKLIGLEGGLFGIEFLQYTGQPTNQLAGVVQGFNSLDVTPPLIRQELYQLWWRQTFFDDKLVVRIGKSVPTYDFNNVVKPVPTGDPAADIPAVSGLIYTPVFVNPTLLGKIPGYFNSATGITTTLAPNKQLYLSYGVYDGNLATGAQTGLRGPQFDGHYFHIGEVGCSWRLGPQRKPGAAAVGLWYQTGTLSAANGALVDGAHGIYGFAAQRLWFRNPGIDNTGVGGFCQFGANNTNTSPVREFVGAGLTAFGLVPGRKFDSLGVGLAWSELNTDPAAGSFFFPDGAPGPAPLRSNEWMMQAYYQVNVRAGVYFQPTMSYIPNPGQRPDIPDAFAITARLTILF